MTRIPFSPASLAALLSLSLAPTALAQSESASGDGATDRPAAGAEQIEVIPKRVCSGAWITTDADRSGTVSDDEVAEARQQEFVELDADENGYLTQEEYKECMAENFDQSAAPSDRSVTNMDMADENSDGAVSSEEFFRAAETAHEGAAKAESLGDESVVDLRRLVFIPASEPNLDVAGRNPEQNVVSSGHLFALLDADGSGDLSEAEWSANSPDSDGAAWIDRSFDRMDADGSGDISRDEYVEDGRRAARDAADLAAARDDTALALDGTQDPDAGPPAAYYRYETAF